MFLAARAAARDARSIPRTAAASRRRRSLPRRARANSMSVRLETAVARRGQQCSSKLDFRGSVCSDGTRARAAARAPPTSLRTSTKCRAQSREEGFVLFIAAGPHMKRGVGKIILRVVESGTLRRGEVLVVRASFFPCWTANESAWENTWRTQANTHLEELIQREKRSPRRVVRPDVRGHEARVVRLVGHAHALAVEQPLPFVVDEPTTVPVRRKEVLAREPVDRF